MSGGWLLLLVFGLCCVCGGNSSPECPHDEFPCNNGECVPKWYWCDTTQDCQDGSDEKYCSLDTKAGPNPNGCDESFFLCKDGICIPKAGRCDGFFSCPDNSDEEGCGPMHETDRTTSVPELTTEKVTTSELKMTTSAAIEHPETTPHDVTTPLVLVFTSSQNASESLQHGDHDVQTDYSVSTDIGNAVNSHDAVEHDRKESVFEVLQESSKASQEVVSTSSVGPELEAANRNDSVQSDSGEDTKERRPPSEVHEEEHLTHKFTDVSSHDYRLQRIDAQKYLLKVRDESYGWGKETARAIAALYMSDEDLKLKQSEKLLMSNRLHLELFSALMRNETKPISLGELALYVNSLSASCDNPRNFYGFDLVSVLRQRTNVAQRYSLVVPFVYLVLCQNNATEYVDAEKLHKFLHNSQNVGIEAMVFLASTCMYRNLQLSSSQRGLATRFLANLQVQGLPNNIYDLALVAQALNEARINQDLWNRSEVMNRIVVSQKDDGSFGDVLSTYYAMPLLSGRSLASSSRHCGQREDYNLVPVEVLKNGKAEKWIINYILRYGNPPELSQTLQLPVKKSASFFDIMRIAETVNPSYRFRYVMDQGKPRVYSIGGVVNDAERGLYWSLYIGSHQHNGTDEDITPFEGDIRSFIPSWGQYAVFWLKPVF